MVAEPTLLLGEFPPAELIGHRPATALARAGRRIDALDVLRRTRRRLADDLGLDPGPALADPHSPPAT